MTRRTCGILPALALIAGLLAGCAIAPSEVKLEPPSITSTAGPNSRIAVIRAVRDERTGGARDPRRLGDVVLAPGQSVEGVIRENLAAALGRAGYQIRTTAPEALEPLFIDVHIRRFAASASGLSGLTVEAAIETELRFTGGAPAMAIAVRSSERRASVDAAAWTRILERALADYRAQATARAAALR